MHRRILLIPAIRQESDVFDPVLTTRQAALLQTAFLRDTMLTATRVTGVETILLATGEDVADLAPAGVTVTSHISDVLDQLDGHGAVVVVRPDVLDITEHDIESAFSLLETHSADVVLGPASGNQCYLVGMRDPSGLAAWEGQDLAPLATASSGKGTRVEHLPRRTIVNDTEGLDWLVHTIRLEGRIPASATRAALHELRREGAPLPDAPTPWTVQHQQVHFDNPFKRLVEDTFRTHTGQLSDYSYLHVPDAVFVVPVTRAGEIVLVRQYRHTVREWLLEVPAGALDGHSARDAAEKELREEIGGSPGELFHLGEFYGCAGNTTHRAYIYAALGVEPGEPSHEPTELMEIETVPAELAFDMARRGEITDGQSVLAVLLAEPRIREWLSTRN